MADNDKIYIDPVCGMEVSEENAAGKSRYQGEKYFFCSDECKEKFDALPAEFATSLASKG